jgi:hypothetical protein
MVDFEAICRQLDIPYWTSGKNNVEGCLTIHCPCCPPDDPDPSRHGNLDPTNGSYSCWRCKGSHPAVVIARAGRISVNAAEDLVRKYTTGTVNVRREKVSYADTIKLPGSGTPQQVHRDYLEGKRGFDLSELEFYHGIRYTGMMERWEGVDWGLRVIIPVHDRHNNLISFQGRDCTGKSSYRYLFPPKEKQVKDSKTVLYGAELCGGMDKILVVEGVMDAWKAGRGAVCTFGTGVHPLQILEMSHWKNVYIAFDNEPAAMEHARQVAKELSALGSKAFLVNTDFGLNPDGSVKDIGDLSIDDARHFRKTVIGI